MNQWLDTPGGPIYYASPDVFGPRGVVKALTAHDFDIVYLNSFFSLRASIFPYITLRGHSPKRRILLAPRGEFSPGALALKKYKKQFFLSLIRLLGFYRDVSWHASTPMEAEDILRLFPTAADRIYIAADPVLTALTKPKPLVTIKKPGLLRMVFISRVSQMKNLDGLIRILASVNVQVKLDIFGPIEDEAYWKLCKESIARLPYNIEARFHGPISPEVVSSTFAQYDIFAFPTHGENFGHVIFESLRAGVPVLVSDQTPWRSDENGAVTVIPLQDDAGCCDAIEKEAHRTTEDQEQVHYAAERYASRYAAESGSQKENVEMFMSVLNS